MYWFYAIPISHYTKDAVFDFIEIVIWMEAYVVAIALPRGGMSSGTKTYALEVAYLRKGCSNR